MNATVIFTTSSGAQTANLSFNEQATFIWDFDCSAVDACEVIATYDLLVAGPVTDLGIKNTLSGQYIEDPSQLDELSNDVRSVPRPQAWVK